MTLFKTIITLLPAAVLTLGITSCGGGQGKASGNTEDESIVLPPDIPQKVYVRTPASIIDDTLSSHICALAGKGDSLKVTGYDTVFVKAVGLPKEDPGYKAELYRIRRLKVKTFRSGKEGYIFARYTVDSLHKALERYKPEIYDSIQTIARDRFKAGSALSCDYWPYERPDFVYKKMPRPCNAFYLNISPAGLRRIDEYIALADSTRINAFVIDIKDDDSPGYKAEAFERWSPTSFARAGREKEELYERAVRRIHERGYYAIGRITCFKDKLYAKDHPENAILDRRTGEPFVHDGTSWPSAYSREVWQFNVNLAKESVRKFGFDEINFDYVRFPDRVTSLNDSLDYRNIYNETKVQAIQNFVRYATDELHEEGVAVSVDVFGESANKGYTTAYGQYWPAISNIADAICAMPYPDHFSDNYYGISKPWRHPYQILRAWGERAAARQRETPSPGRARTWIQSYKVMKHIDRQGPDNDSTFIASQLQGLYDAGLRDGFNTWMSSGSIATYRKQKAAYARDYSVISPSLP
ncbi:MAG: putative glycoside hydrolase [Candidatus Cryptobacteroides sp.]|nr:putative glycoside hydrolase [Candidatus Cryptobacteroides sp.]